MLKNFQFILNKAELVSYFLGYVQSIYISFEEIKLYSEKEDDMQDFDFSHYIYNALEWLDQVVY